MNKFRKTLIAFFSALCLVCFGLVAVACGGDEPEPEQYVVELSYNAEQGEVSKSPDKALYDLDEKVTITVTAKGDYVIDGVTVNGTAVTLTDGAYELTVKGNTTVVATFKAEQSQTPPPVEEGLPAEYEGTWSPAPVPGSVGEELDIVVEDGVLSYGDTEYDVTETEDGYSFTVGSGEDATVYTVSLVEGANGQLLCLTVEGNHSYFVKEGAVAYSGAVAEGFYGSWTATADPIEIVANGDAVSVVIGIDTATVYGYEDEVLTVLWNGGVYTLSLDGDKLLLTSHDGEDVVEYEKSTHVEEPVLVPEHAGTYVSNDGEHTVVIDEDGHFSYNDAAYDLYLIDAEMDMYYIMVDGEKWNVSLYGDSMSLGEYSLKKVGAEEIAVDSVLHGTWKGEDGSTLEIGEDGVYLDGAKLTVVQDISNLEDEDDEWVLYSYELENENGKSYYLTSKLTDNYEKITLNYWGVDGDTDVVYTKDGGEVEEKDEVAKMFWGTWNALGDDLTIEIGINSVKINGESVDYDFVVIDEEWDVYDFFVEWNGQTWLLALNVNSNYLLDFWVYENEEEPGVMQADASASEYLLLKEEDEYVVKVPEYVAASYNGDDGTTLTIAADGKVVCSGTDTYVLIGADDYGFGIPDFLSLVFIVNGEQVAFGYGSGASVAEYKGFTLYVDYEPTVTYTVEGWINVPDGYVKDENVEVGNWGQMLPTNYTIEKGEYVEFHGSFSGKSTTTYNEQGEPADVWQGIVGQVFVNGEVGANNNYYFFRPDCPVKVVNNVWNFWDAGDSDCAWENPAWNAASYQAVAGGNVVIRVALSEEGVLTYTISFKGDTYSYTNVYTAGTEMDSALVFFAVDGATAGTATVVHPGTIGGGEDNEGEISEEYHGTWTLVKDAGSFFEGAVDTLEITATSVEASLTDATPAVTFTVDEWGSLTFTITLDGTSFVYEVIAMTDYLLALDGGNIVLYYISENLPELKVNGQFAGTWTAEGLEYNLVISANGKVSYGPDEGVVVGATEEDGWYTYRILFGTTYASIEIGGWGTEYVSFWFNYGDGSYEMTEYAVESATLPEELWGETWADEWQDWVLAIGADGSVTFQGEEVVVYGNADDGYNFTDSEGTKWALYFASADSYDIMNLSTDDGYTLILYRDGADFTVELPEELLGTTWKGTGDNEYVTKTYGKKIVVVISEDGTITISIDGDVYYATLTGVQYGDDEYGNAYYLHLDVDGDDVDWEFPNGFSGNTFESTGSGFAFTVTLSSGEEEKTPLILDEEYYGTYSDTLENFDGKLTVSEDGVFLGDDQVYCLEDSDYGYYVVEINGVEYKLLIVMGALTFTAEETPVYFFEKDGEVGDTTDPGDPVPSDWAGTYKTLDGEHTVEISEAGVFKIDGKVVTIRLDARSYGDYYYVTWNDVEWELEQDYYYSDILKLTYTENYNDTTFVFLKEDAATDELPEEYYGKSYIGENGDSLTIDEDGKLVWNGNEATVLYVDSSTWYIVVDGALYKVSTYSVDYLYVYVFGSWSSETFSKVYDEITEEFHGTWNALGGHELTVVIDAETVKIGSDVITDWTFNGAEIILTWNGQEWSLMLNYYSDYLLDLVAIDNGDFGIGYSVAAEDVSEYTLLKELDGDEKYVDEVPSFFSGTFVEADENGRPVEGGETITLNADGTVVYGEHAVLLLSANGYSWYGCEVYGIMLIDGEAVNYTASGEEDDVLDYIQFAGVKFVVAPVRLPADKAGTYTGEDNSYTEYTLIITEDGDLLLVYSKYDLDLYEWVDAQEIVNVKKVDDNTYTFKGFQSYYSDTWYSGNTYTLTFVEGEAYAATLYYTNYTGYPSTPINLTKQGGGEEVDDSWVDGVHYNEDGTLDSYDDEKIAAAGGVVHIKDGVTAIPANFFEGSTALKEVIFPASLTNINASAFKNCTALTNVDFSATTSFTRIDNYAFEGCVALTKIELPESTTTIGLRDYVFRDCTSLKVVILSSSVTSLWDGVFSGCEIDWLEIPGGLEIGAVELGDATVKVLKFLDGTTDIKQGFSSSLTATAINGVLNADGLERIIFPAGVELVRDNVFMGSNGTKLPAGVELCFVASKDAAQASFETRSAGSWAAFRATLPEDVVIKYGYDIATGEYEEIEEGDGDVGGGEEEPKEEWVDGVLYEGTTMKQFDNAQIPEDGVVHIKDGVTEIPVMFFADSTALKGIVLPASVKTIGASAFVNCSALATIDLSSVQMVAARAFYGSGLTTITLSGSVTTWGGGMATSGAFAECKQLKEVIFSNTIPADQEFGTYLFYNCTALTTITFQEGCAITKLANYMFSGCTSLESVTLPASITSLDTYVFQNCSGLKDVDLSKTQMSTLSSTVFSASKATLETFKFPAGMTAIDGSFFSGYAKLTSVTLPSALTGINYNVFQNCTSLTTIDLPAGIATIGNLAFQGCTALTTVTFAPDSQLTEIGTSAFSGCTSLATIDLPATVNCIGDYAFQNSGLTSIILPEGLKALGDHSFEGSAVKSVVIPCGDLTYRLTSQSDCDYIFKACLSLETVEFTGALTKICKGWFEGCTALKKVTLSEHVIEIKQDAFKNCSSLTTINTHDGMTIHETAFEGCDKLGSGEPEYVTDENVTVGNWGQELPSNYTIQKGEYVEFHGSFTAKEVEDVGYGLVAQVFANGEVGANNNYYFFRPDCPVKVVNGVWKFWGESDCTWDRPDWLDRETEVGDAYMAATSGEVTITVALSEEGVLTVTVHVVYGDAQFTNVYTAAATMDSALVFFAADHCTPGTATVTHPKA